MFFEKLRICASNGFPPSSSSPSLAPDACDSSVFDGGIKSEGTVEGGGGACGGGGGGAGGGTDVETELRGIIAGISTGGGAGTEQKKQKLFRLLYQNLFTSGFRRFNLRYSCRC